VAGQPRTCVAFVRVNPLDGELTTADLTAVLPAAPDGIMLPRAEGAAGIHALIDLANGVAVPPILPIATEPPRRPVRTGQLPAGQGQAGRHHLGRGKSSRVGRCFHIKGGGRPLHRPFEMARRLTLFAAHAAGVAAIDTVVPPDRCDG